MIMTLSTYTEIYSSKEEWDHATNLPGEDDVKLSDLAAEYRRLIDIGHTPSEAAAVVDSALDLESFDSRDGGGVRRWPG